MRLGLLLAIAGLALVACRNRAASLSFYGVIPDFTLTAQTGSEFRSQSLLGKVWIADFIYTTCPGPCPMMSSRMQRLQKEVAGWGDVQLVSFTVDPATDTPAVLAGYAQRYHADSTRWLFLTGSHDALQQLSRDAFHVADLNRGLDHSIKFVLVDRKLRIRGYYSSSNAEVMSQLLTDIKALLEERT